MYQAGLGEKDTFDKGFVNTRAVPKRRIIALYH